LREFNYIESKPHKNGETVKDRDISTDQRKGRLFFDSFVCRGLMRQSLHF